MLALSHSSSCPFIVMPVAAINSHSLSSVNVIPASVQLGYALCFLQRMELFSYGVVYFLGLNVYIPCVKSNRVWALKAPGVLGCDYPFFTRLPWMSKSTLQALLFVFKYLLSTIYFLHFLPQIRLNFGCNCPL